MNGWLRPYRRVQKRPTRAQLTCEADVIFPCWSARRTNGTEPGLFYENLP